LKIVHPPLSLLAIPTTSGTGSEATKNSVISSYSPPFKKSLRSDWMMPRCVLVDPELAVSVPPAITAHTGMDTVTQLIESYISRRAKPIPQALALHGLQLALPALPAAYHDGNCRWAREAMAHAALLSGMALANSGLGIAHGVAAALGAECKVRHGLACAVMLPAALRFNRSVCETQYAEMERAIAAKTDQRFTPQSDQQAAEAFIARIDQLAQALSIPGKLRELNVLPAQLPALVSGSQGNSLSGNPREISRSELAELLHTIW
jgi:alcohol dehydrogenase class IV